MSYINGSTLDFPINNDYEKSINQHLIMDTASETKPISNLPQTTRSDKKAKKSQKGASDNGYPLEV